jgi:pimeloyl-ACP methyl ester carboxylesterase
MLRRRFNTLAALLPGLSALPAARAQNDGAPPFLDEPEPVSWASAGASLVGGFLKPHGAGPFPAVVLVHGAGPSVHNEPAYRVHANAFLQAGFAVLVYDKRGSGRSGGDLAGASFEDLAADVATALQLLRARKDVVATAVGLLGRSEGGWVATLTASHDKALAFVILSSGSASRPSQDNLHWTRRLLQAKGAAVAEIDEALVARSAQWAFYRRVVSNPEWGRSPAGQAERAAAQQRLRACKGLSPEVTQDVADPLLRPIDFFRAFTKMIDFDPLPALRSLHPPLLAVIGADDEAVDAPATVAALEQLRLAGRPVSVRVLPALGHSLLVATAQGPCYAADYPEFAVRWARQQIGLQTAARTRRCQAGARNSAGSTDCALR